MKVTSAGKASSKRATLLLQLSCLAALLVGFTACSSSPAPTIETEAQNIVEDFLVSKSANRSGSSVLDASVVAGRVYVFTAQTTGIKQVDYYLDDAKRAGTPYQTEAQSPYDLNGGSTSSANALDTTKLTDGVHKVTARVRYTSGSEKVSTATFLVNNGGKLGNALLVSSNPDRSGAKLLGSSNVTGKVHVFVMPTASVKQISFYVDDSSRSGTPAQSERIAFYDFAGTTTTGEANSFDTAKLKNGQHTLTAAIITSSGQTQVVNASFTVGVGSTSATPPTTSPTATTSVRELRGNPNFSKSQLTAEQLKWYDTVWAVINNPYQHPNAVSLAKSGNSYLYRGDLQDYITSLLTSFRLTGDLRLLDSIDNLAQLMRNELADGWQGTLDGTDGTKDGFLNWVDNYDKSPYYKGKDTNRAFDIKANTLVAEIAWALHNNRDLKSPGGVDYGAHADFWENYLVNHFEKKWRKRNGILSGFPFSPEVGLHTYHSFMKWHYYMGKLTGNGAYNKEAERMADVLWNNEFKDTASQYGTALVWPRAVESAGASKDLNYLMPQTYARYVVEEVIDLHFEGFNRYASDANVRKVARAVSSFVINDSSFDSFARDIGGGVSRAGIPASSTSWTGMVGVRFAESSWSFLAAWDTNSGDRIEKAARDIFYTVENQKYNATPKRIFIPTAMFIKEMVGR